MPLDIKGIVNGGLDVQEALGRTRRFETLLFSFSTPDGLMRILGTIISTPMVDVLSR